MGEAQLPFFADEPRPSERDDDSGRWRSPHVDKRLIPA